MFTGHVVDIDGSLALSAAQLSAQEKLPMADSLILAVARAHNAVLWTQDEHFKGLAGVQYIEKPNNATQTPRFKQTISIIVENPLPKKTIAPGGFSILQSSIL